MSNQHDLQRIISCLFNDIKPEFKAFKLAYQRLKTRLRNCELTAKLKRVVGLIKKLEHFIIWQVPAETWYKHAWPLIQLINDLLDQTVFLYSFLQQYFKVGHLIHHLIVLRATLARSRVCLKALLVHATDFYLDKFPKNATTICLVQDILNKHQCKYRVEKSPVTIDIDVDTLLGNKEEIGQLVQRDPIESSKHPTRIPQTQVTGKKKR